MNCDDFNRNLHAYYVGTLTEAQRRDIERHAASGCEPCGRLYAVAQELSCRELVEFLDDFVENRLPADRRTVFERHIELCGDCRDFIAGYRRVQGAARIALACDDAAPLPEELVRAILAARKA